jgi:hypothetical protein
VGEYGWVFPTVTGRDLAGREYRMPDDLPAKLTVAIIAFRQWQQRQVDAWISALVAAGVPGTPRGAQDLASVVIEIPVLPGRYSPARRFIDGGMATSIRDPDILARTITVYGNVDRFCAPLGIVSRDDVSVRIAERSGAVRWGTTGPVSDERVAAALIALESGTGHP